MSIDMSTAARMALYAADAECLFDALPGDRRGIPVVPSPCAPPFALLESLDWQPVAQIRCDDDLRVLQWLKRRIGLKQDNYFYGFLLQRLTPGDPNFAAGDYLAIVRGTIEPQEWALDATATPELFAGVSHHLAGLVPSGFYSIYKSMTLVDSSGHTLGDAATAIGNIVNQDNRPVTVVGHSLGSALATYLTSDLADEVHNPAKSLNAYVVASPNTGTIDFVKAFRNHVPNYNVVNWQRDIVPRLPPVPFLPLLNGSPSQNVVQLAASTVFAAAMPNDNPLCNHHAACYALMLDPTNADALALTRRFGCLVAAPVAAAI